MRHRPMDLGCIFKSIDHPFITYPALRNFRVFFYAVLQQYYEWALRHNYDFQGWEAMFPSAHCSYS